MNSLGNHALAIERINREKIRASCSFDLEDGQRIGLTLSLPSQPDRTIAQIEQDLVRLAVRRLQLLLQE